MLRDAIFRVCNVGKRNPLQVAEDTLHVAISDATCSGLKKSLQLLQKVELELVLHGAIFFGSVVLLSAKIEWIRLKPLQVAARGSNVKHDFCNLQLAMNFFF